MNNEKTIKMIGDENINNLSKLNILIVGVGGVGSYVLESLARSNIKNITIIDSDIVEESNLNRQIIALNSTIMKNKVDVAKSRMLDINKDINIRCFNLFLTADNIEILNNEKYDYIIDACDTVTTKIALIKYAYKNNIKIISCMGTGNRLDPSKLEITKLSKTFNDPLAKSVRQILRKDNINYNPLVLFSKELPIKVKDHKPGSMCFVPASAGLLISSYIIRENINI